MTRDEFIRLYIDSRDPDTRVVRVTMAAACVLTRCVELAFTLLRRPAPISPYRLRSAYRMLTFDCEKARTQLGWRPRVPGAALRVLLKSPPISARPGSPQHRSFRLLDTANR